MMESLEVLHSGVIKYLCGWTECDMVVIIGNGSKREESEWVNTLTCLNGEMINWESRGT